MQGRKRKPTNQKKVEGTYRADRSNPDEPQPEIEMPECPPELDEDAQRVWHELGSKLLALGVLSNIDGDSFAALCACRSKLRKIWLQQPMVEKLYIKALRKGDLNWMKDLRSDRKWLMQEERLYLEKWIRIAPEFGITPSSRTKIHAKKSPKQQSDYEKWKEPQAAIGNQQASTGTIH